VTERQTRQESDLPTGLAKPAQPALANAGYLRLKDLGKLSEAEVKQLHGMGPRALDQLRRALRANGLSFAKAEDAEAVAHCGGGVHPNDTTTIETIETIETGCAT